MFDFEKNEKVYTVLEINEAVRDVIRDAFPQNVWVCGEIQGFKDRNQIINFDLVQKDADSDSTIARASAVIFQNFRYQVLSRLREVDQSLQLKDDIEVKCLCKVDFYPKNGKFSLRVVDIDPAFTLGKIAQNRQKLIEELKKRGLLEKNKIHEIGLVPLRIGLITADGSAAYHDFLNELAHSGYGFAVSFCDSYMQGKFVESCVTAALSRFRLMSDSLDAVVITRGGGSTVDLSWFDNKKIAETIADFPLPVLSGLGHEINITVTDLVAHTSLKTPTKAAQFLIERVGRFLESVENTGDEIIKNALGKFSLCNQSLQLCARKVESTAFNYFRYHLQQLLEEEKECMHFAFNLLRRKKDVIKTSAFHVNTIVAQYFRKHAESLAQRQTECKNRVFLRLRDEREQLTRSFGRLREKSLLMIKWLQERIFNVREKVELLNPWNVLKRGYSIVLKEGRVVKSIGQVGKKDVIENVFVDGYILSRVEEKRNKKEGA